MLDTWVSVPLVPLVTVTSLASKPLTASLKVNVKVTGPEAVPAVSSVMAAVGATESTVNPVKLARVKRCT